MFYRWPRCGSCEMVISVADVIQKLGYDGNWRQQSVKTCIQQEEILTHSGEEHVVQEEGDGHDDQDQLPGLPGRVEVGAYGGAGHVLRRLGAHPPVSSAELAWVGDRVNLCSDKGSRANFVKMLPLYFKTNLAPFVAKWNQIRLEVLMGEHLLSF